MKTPAKAARSLRRFAQIETLENRQLMSTTIDITTSRAQTIDGFGTSLGGQTSGTVINSASFQKAYYRDMGASMFRAVLNPWLLRGETKNGGVSMGSPVYLGPHLSDNIDLFNFNDPNIKKYGTMARAAQKYGDDVKIIGSFWSPPYWMKGEEVSAFNGKPTGVMPTFNDKTGNTAGGSLIDTDANLTQFGRYIASYVAGFQQAYGVKLYAVSIQNELAFHEAYSSCVYSPDLYVKAVKAVAHWFQVWGLDTKIQGPEDVGVGATDNTGMLNRQMQYIKALRRDPDAMAAVDVYSIHGYANDGTTPDRSTTMWARYWNGYDGDADWNSFTGIKADHKPSWMTEQSGFGSTWNATLRLASSIQDDLVYGNVSAYVYWGVSNTTNTGESLMKNDDYAAGKYNAMKHFSKFIRPGSVRLQTSGGDQNGVYASAFADDAHGTLTSVLINNSPEAQTVTLRLNGISLSKFGTAYATTEDNTWYALSAYGVHDGHVTFTMPARSIFTLAGSTGGSAASKAKPTGTISGTYFFDANKSGKIDKGETAVAGAKVFLDLDADGVRDKKEPMVVTNKSGAYQFTGLAAGVYRVRRVLASGFTQTTDPTVSRVRKGSISIAGVNLGIAQTTTTKPPSGGGGGASGASIAGHLFADDNGNGKQDGSEPNAAGKVVYLDANNNGALDKGETKATSDSKGNFTFTGLKAGTYRVRRVFPQGYFATTTTAAITLTANQKKTGVLIGSKAR